MGGPIQNHICAFGIQEGYTCDDLSAERGIFNRREPFDGIH